MSYKIKCTYVANGEPFTLCKEYNIYVSDEGVYYIKNDYGRKTGYFRNNDTPLIDGLLESLHAEHHSNFTPCITLEEPEKDIKKEVHELLDKATELIYNNQEELNITLDDFITLIRIKEDLKWNAYTLD